MFGFVVWVGVARTEGREEIMKARREMLTGELLHDGRYFPDQLGDRDLLVVGLVVQLGLLPGLAHEYPRVGTHPAVDHANLFRGGGRKQKQTRKERTKVSAMLTR